MNYIYTESSKKFDGDCDILWAEDNVLKSNNEKINLKILLSDHLAKKRFKNKSVRNNCKDLDVSIKRDVCY